MFSHVSKYSSKSFHHLCSCFMGAYIFDFLDRFILSYKSSDLPQTEVPGDLMTDQGHNWKLTKKESTVSKLQRPKLKITKTSNQYQE